jgi:hypothetical protein
MAGLTALSFALIEGQSYDWGQIWSFVSIPLLLVAGVALLVVFALDQRRSQEGEPLMPFSLLRDRNFTLMTTVGACLHEYAHPAHLLAASPRAPGVGAAPCDAAIARAAFRETPRGLASAAWSRS